MKKAALACLLFSGCVFAATPQKCQELARTSFGPDVKIDSAAMVPATDHLREYCDVRGVIWPENHFAVKLPSSWNNRFEMVGNGGWAGTISLEAMDAAVRDGYASASTDTGHDAKKEPGATFAYPGPDNPYAARKVIDHGYLAVHETALLAKKMIRAYYGSDPRFSYWVGCSTGGRQGLMEAQRYPEDFDGYVVGAPVLYLTGLQMKAIWNYLAIGPGPGELPPDKHEILMETVYRKCDGIDGLEDGLIENPLVCNFDAARDLEHCSVHPDSPACFTDAQIAGIKKVFQGPRDSKGRQLFPGVPMGADDSSKLNFGLGDTFMKFMAFDPAPGPNWDYHSFNFDTDVARMSSTGLRINATIPDLSAVKARGGKIVHYHGWSDPGVTPLMSVNYYEAALKTMGKAETRDFYRLFLVPGMFHCRGGPGCGNADWLEAVVNWVEKGIAPNMIEGTHIENGRTTRTRPICAYPATARYKGTGSTDMAENFTCVSNGL